MSERLFFALWPDEGLRAELASRFASLQAVAPAGRPQRPDQWHVTLEFLGNVPAERRSALHAAADRVAMRSFTIDFDRVEHWRQPEVLCLVASAAPADLSTFVAGLRAALAAAGFAPEQRPFRPHVTLARKVRQAAPATLARPVSWPADRFALVRSVTAPAGSRYEPLRWWNCAVDGGGESGVSGQFFGPRTGGAVE